MQIFDIVSRKSKRHELITLVARLRLLPAVYPFRYFTTDGALISYGPSLEAEHTFQPARQLAHAVSETGDRGGNW